MSFVNDWLGAFSDSILAFMLCQILTVPKFSNHGRNQLTSDFDYFRFDMTHLLLLIQLLLFSVLTPFFFSGIEPIIFGALFCLFCLFRFCSNILNAMGIKAHPLFHHVKYLIGLPPANLTGTLERVNQGTCNAATNNQIVLSDIILNWFFL